MTNINLSTDIEENYRNMVNGIKNLLQNEKDVIANLSNVSAIIYSSIEKINWAGFYILKENELVLGPFQGLPACIRIKMGKGVCGSAAQQEKTVVVDNVHNFQGHIACDSASNSEIVLPLFKHGKLYGVLDVDSPELNRFTVLEEKYLGMVSNLISEFLDNEN